MAGPSAAGPGRPLRVLHVAPTVSLTYGGAAKACLDIARSVAARGHEVDVYTSNYDGAGGFTSDGGGEPYDAGGGVRVREFKIGPVNYRHLSAAFARALRDDVTGYDVVHVHEIYIFQTVAATYYCRAKGVPYVLQPHGSLNPFVRRRRRGRKYLMELVLLRRLARRAALIQYTTAEEMRSAPDYLRDRPGAVVPLGLDLAEYRPLPPRGAFRARHPELADGAIVLFLGRIDRAKGLDVLARAFGRVAGRRDDVRLVIAGRDVHGHRAEVEAWLREAGVLGRTVFTGMITGAEKLAAFRDADLFVLSSYTENFGISVVEAMACGLPVLVSDRVALWGDVVDGGAGRVAPCDPDAFADAMLEMLADGAARAAWGRRGIEVVRARFSWDAIGAQQERAYRAVVGDRGARSSSSPARSGRS